MAPDPTPAVPSGHSNNNAPSRQFHMFFNHAGPQTSAAGGTTGSVDSSPGAEALNAIGNPIKTTDEKNDIGCFGFCTRFYYYFPRIAFCFCKMFYVFGFFF
jgi:hypothetical protein